MPTTSSARAARPPSTTAPRSTPSTPRLKRIDASIEQIRGGNLLDRLLNDDKKDTLTWYWQLKTLPDAPESRYLYQLLASNEFQEGLKNYRELNFMSRNLDDWREDVCGLRQHARHAAARPTTSACRRPMR